MLHSLRLRNCISYINLPSTSSFFQRTPFSVSRSLLQGNSSNTQRAIFVPSAPSTERTAFSKQSPIKQQGLEGISEASPPAVSIDNYSSFETQWLPETGKLSGRTVSCPIGRISPALYTLNRIIHENKIREEFHDSYERLKPSEARRRLRAKRHRRRFKQGVARLANIVLRMRKKNY